MTTRSLSRLLLILHLLFYLSSIAVCVCNTNCCDQNTRCCFELVEGNDLGRAVGNARQLPEFEGVFNSSQQLVFVQLTFIGSDPLVSDPLQINETSGDVTTTSPIDRENATEITNNNCFFKIVNLQYQFPNQNVMTIGSGAGFFVDVQDVNDNSPKFESHGPVNVTAAETNSENPAFACSSMLIARDEDAGVNAELNYTIIGNPNFTASYDESNVRVCIKNKVMVDRETTPFVELILEASDNGLPSRSSNVTVVIQITDINDNNPVFQHSSPLVINVPEDTPVGSVILNLNATDEDIGQNAEISYTFQTSDILPFAVNMTTGAITLKNPLDFESDNNKVFVMNVIARNTGFQDQMATLQITVNIIDVNDNRPSVTVVLPTDFNISVPLRIMEGPIDHSSALIVFRVTDADSGLNGNVKINVTNGYNFYMITDTTFGQIFRLIPVVSSIDRELVSQINLTIIFYDQGNPSLNVTTQLTVIVEDVNDNAPMLTRTNFSVSENLRSGVSIAELQDYYFDPDNGNNGTLGEVEQLSGTNFILVSNTGSMRTSMQTLDRESNELVEVRLRLFDQGTPMLNSTVTLYIRILDLNDNPPVFKQLSYTFSISENEPNSIDFGQVMAEDPDKDKNGTVEYKLNNGMSFFTINSTTGYLSTNMSFDRESNDTYFLSVIAVDQGDPPQTAATIVEIIITDKNDETPIFVKTCPTNELSAGSPEGTLLCVVQAEDPDEISELSYELSGQGAPHFNINSTGAITTAAMVVGEPGVEWSLTVNVTDGVFSNSTSMSITITAPTQMPTSSPLLLIAIGSGVGAVVIIVLICFLVTAVIFSICRCRKRKSVSLVSIEAPRRSSLRATPSNIDRDISLTPSSPTALSKSPTVNFSEEVAVQIYSEQTPAKRRYETVVLRDNQLDNNIDGKEMEMLSTAKSSPPIQRSKAPISPPLADELSGSSSTVSEYPSYLPPPHPHSAQSVPVLRADVLKEHDRVYSEGNMLAGSHSHFPLGIVERALDDGDIATYPDDESNFPAAFPSALHHYITPGHSNPSISVPVSRLVSQSASPPSEESSPTLHYVRSPHPRSDAMYYSHEPMKLRSPHGHYHDHDRHHHLYEHSMSSPRHQNGIRRHHYSSSSSSSQQTAIELPPPHYPPPPPHHHISREPPLHLYSHMNGHMPLHPPPAHYSHHPPPLPPPSAVPHTSILPPPPMHTHYPSFTSEDNSTVASSVLEEMLKFDPKPPLDGYDPLSLTDQPLDTGRH